VVEVVEEVEVVMLIIGVDYLQQVGWFKIFGMGQQHLISYQ
jgi:hypothetical protein